MKLKRPSPAMVVAVVALVSSMTGGAIAAVNYAKNSNAVDGYSAVKAAKAGSGKAAGKLVATYRDGENRGRLPLRTIAGAASERSLDNLADSVARAKNAARTIAVTDNQTTAAETVIDLELGDLQFSCDDQQANAGTENAATHVSVTNKSGAPLNLARQHGDAAPIIATLQPGVVETFTVGQQNTFHVQLQGVDNRTVVINGTAQQVGQGTADSSCVAWATAFFVE